MNCPLCGKNTSREDIADLGMCRSCDHLEGEGKELSNEEERELALERED